MIWIRADANSEIGTGHVMRCISIAAELQKMEQEVCFVVADRAGAELLSSRGQRFHVLNTNYKDMESELDILLPLLNENAPNALLIDSYYVTPGYLKKVREYVKTIYIDDMMMFPYPVDLLINYNVYAEPDMYESYDGESGRILTGMQYAPLRQEFCESVYNVRENVINIFITTGGNDMYNIAGQVLQKVLSDDELCQLHYHVVSGIFNEYLSDLKEMALKNQNVHVYTNVKNMSDLMKQCDVAITAAGSTMCELAAIGVPSITFSFVDNQRKTADAFGIKNLAVSIGHYNAHEREGFLNEMAVKLKGLKEDYRQRSLLMKYCKEAVDGHGAKRIAQEIIKV